MKIIVLMAQVPATDIKAQIGADGKSLATDNVKFVINPYDEYAIEEALQLKEKNEGEVVLISMGPDRVPTGLREGLAVGADRAVHIQAEDTYYDPYTVAKALVAQIKTMEYDLLLVGKIGVGYDHHQVGAMVADMLDLPHVATVTHLEIANGTATVKREIEGATEVVQTSLPALFSAEKGLNDPRYASLKGIMAAKRKPMETKALADLLPDAGGKLNLVKMELPPVKQRGKLIPADEPADAAKELIRLLSEEAKVL